MKQSRRKYDAEFKRQAVRMVTEGGRNCHAVEKDLGIGAGLLYRWVHDVKTDPTESFPGNGRVKASVADVNGLIKEIDQLRREREILKKALSIFSRTSTPAISSSLSMVRN